jgi:GT2 family glycosyltransferase
MTIPPLIVRLGKLTPKSLRSLAYIGWTSVEGTLRRKPVLIGDESGVLQTREAFWGARSQVVSTTLRPWIGVSSVSQSDLPEIDISVVTYNSREVVGGLLDSILHSNYPLAKLHLRITDNSSTDETVEYVRSRQHECEAALLTFDLQIAPNKGFGAGHNSGIRRGSAPYSLVINPDLQLHPDCLVQLAVRALQSPPEWVAFEPRQFPYEHPKIYDPVTHEVSWNSHACLLMKREAFNVIDGYDESIFLYGEDVEISFRLREAGFRLAYVPSARAEHDALDSPTRSSLLQFQGGISSNLRIRARYGDQFARIASHVKVMSLVRRRDLAMHRSFLAAQLRHLPGLLKQYPVNEKLDVGFPIVGWEFELRRDGHDVPAGSAFDDFPTNVVSVITRTIARHEIDLIETIVSVANQTYPHVEHIVVFDGIDVVPQAVLAFCEALPNPVKFVHVPKCGRSAAGNAGVAAASGDMLLFLDDDDLLFADHVEILVGALSEIPRAAAAYSRAFEVTVDRIDGVLGADKSIEVPQLHRQPFDFQVLLHHNYMAIQSVLFRRSIFEQRGGLREDLELLEDWNLWIRYAYKQHFIEVPKVTSMYRVSASAPQNEKRRRSLSDAYLRVRAENELDLHALDRTLS